MTQIFTEKTVEKAKELAAKTWGVAESDIKLKFLRSRSVDSLGL